MSGPEAVHLSWCTSRKRYLGLCKRGSTHAVDLGRHRPCLALAHPTLSWANA